MRTRAPVLGSALALVGIALAFAVPGAIAIRIVGALLVIAAVVVLVRARQDDVIAAHAQLARVRERATRIAKGEPLADDDGDDDTLLALRKVAGKMTGMVEARVHIMATSRDLDEARGVYRQILPLSSKAEHGTLALAGVCSPAAETGGDWWTYRKLAGGKLLLVIGDAIGHGVHSAMVGCMAHGAVRALTQLGEDFLSARKVLDAVNTAIRVPGVEHAPMTLFAATIDPAAGTVTYFNHGHVFPLIAVVDANGVISDVTSITGSHDLDEDVGDSTDPSIELEIRQGTAKLGPGMVLICFTDGLIERANANGRPFGGRRLHQALLGAVAPPGVDGLVALRDRLIARVDDYVEHAPLEDDITLVLCGISAAT